MPWIVTSWFSPGKEAQRKRKEERVIQQLEKQKMKELEEKKAKAEEEEEKEKSHGEHPHFRHIRPNLCLTQTNQKLIGDIQYEIHEDK